MHIIVYGRVLKFPLLYTSLSLIKDSFYIRLVHNSWLWKALYLYKKNSSSLISISSSILLNYEIGKGPLPYGKSGLFSILRLVSVWRLTSFIFAKLNTLLS